MFKIIFFRLTSFFNSLLRPLVVSFRQRLWLYRWRLFAFILILGLLALSAFSSFPHYSLRQQESDCSAVLQLTPLFPSPTPAPTRDYTCPVGNPTGYGTLTPSSDWLANCEQCLTREAPTSDGFPTIDYSTWTPEGTAGTPVPTGSGTPGTPTGTVTPAPTWKIMPCCGDNYEGLFQSLPNGDALFIVNEFVHIGGHEFKLRVVSVPEGTATPIPVPIPFTMYYRITNSVTSIMPPVDYSPCDPEITHRFLHTSLQFTFKGRVGDDILPPLYLEDHISGDFHCSSGEEPQGLDVYSDANGSYVVDIDNTYHWVYVDSYVSNPSGVLVSSYIHFSLSPIPTATPTPTPVPGGYCSVIDPDPGDGGGGCTEDFCPPDVRVGDPICAGLPEFVIPLGWLDAFLEPDLPDIVVPALEICFIPLYFGTMQFYSQTIDLDLIAFVVAAAMLVRWALRSV